MPYDPTSRLYRPDFQTNQNLPQWTPMGEQDDQSGQNAGSFTAFLKKKMGGTSKGAGMAGTEGKGLVGAEGGGGMESL